MESHPVLKAEFCLDDKVMLINRSAVINFPEGKYGINIKYCPACRRYLSYHGMEKDINIVAADYFRQMPGWPRYDRKTCTVELL